ncbi:MAG: HEPN domain-containing protein [Paludibacter sp.]
MNRIYYGMYYSLTALALANSFETSKHGQLIGWFNKEFILTNKLDSKFGKILRNAFQNRTKGDYDAFISFTQQEVEIMLNEMVEFIEEIKKTLN